MSLISAYYKNMILCIHRGNHYGVFSNAKPLFLLAIISCIDKKTITGNCFILNESLIEEYNMLSKLHEPKRDVTPIGKPYFHLNAEPFYTIVYRKGVVEPMHSESPSLKRLKEIIEDVKLDEELWQLLQNAEIRQEYSEAIIKYFLNK